MDDYCLPKAVPPRDNTITAPLEQQRLQMTSLSSTGSKKTLSQFSLHEGKKRPASSYNKAMVNIAEVVSTGALHEPDHPNLMAVAHEGALSSTSAAAKVRPPRPSTSKTVRVPRATKTAYGYKGLKPVLNNLGAAYNDMASENRSAMHSSNLDVIEEAQPKHKTAISRKRPITGGLRGHPLPPVLVKDEQMSEPLPPRPK